MEINLETSHSHTSYLPWTPPFKSSSLTCLVIPGFSVIFPWLWKGREKVSKQWRRSERKLRSGFLGIYISMQLFCWQQYISVFVFSLTIKQIQSKKAICYVYLCSSMLSKSRFGIWQEGKFVECISSVVFFCWNQRNGFAMIHEGNWKHRKEISCLIFTRNMISYNILYSMFICVYMCTWGYLCLFTC